MFRLFDFGSVDGFLHASFEILLDLVDICENSIPKSVRFVTISVSILPITPLLLHLKCSGWIFLSFQTGLVMLAMFLEKCDQIVAFGLYNREHLVLFHLQHVGFQLFQEFWSHIVFVYDQIAFSFGHSGVEAFYVEVSFEFFLNICPSQLRKFHFSLDGHDEWLIFFRPIFGNFIDILPNFEIFNSDLLLSQTGQWSIAHPPNPQQIA